MNIHSQFLCAILMCGLIESAFRVAVIGSAGQSKVSSVKTNNGPVVEGQIKGIIVLKDKVGQSERGPKVTYSLNYTLVSGEGIDAIDEAGVHLGSDAKLDFVSCTQEGNLPDDAEVLARGMSLPAGATKFDAFAKGSTLFHVDVRTGNRSVQTGTLLGEFRAEGQKEGLIPAIEISTEKGVVKIPVGEVVAFKEKAGRPD